MTTLWAIYDENGRQILEKSVFLSYSYSAPSKVMSTPIEKGSFAIYNKVIEPAILKLSLAFKGNDDELELAIKRCEKEKNNTSKLYILSPEKSYTNYSLRHFSYSKSALENVIIFDVEFAEILEIGSYYNSLVMPIENIVNASDASVYDRGRVRAEELYSKIAVKLGGVSTLILLLFGDIAQISSIC